jgi:hypothetical protein
VHTSLSNESDHHHKTEGNSIADTYSPGLFDLQAASVVTITEVRYFFGERKKEQEMSIRAFQSKCEGNIVVYFQGEHIHKTPVLQGKGQQWWRIITASPFLSFQNFWNTMS